MNARALMFLSLIAFGACGDRFDLRDLNATNPTQNFGDTTYVLQQPVWSGFNRPRDVLAGFEPFIYVADAGNNRIVMLDISGRVNGYSRPVQNPSAIAQDHRLNLLVCGEFDSTIGGRSATFGAIYKIDLYAVRHRIGDAPVQRIYVDLLNPSRRYTGIATLADNGFYVARTGPNNTSIVDPDDAIMQFTKDGVPLARQYWPFLSVDGTGLSTLVHPTSVATFPTPNTDFIFTQQGEKSLFRAQWMTFRNFGDVSGWDSYFTPSRNPDADFIRVRLFTRPEDVTVDAAGNIFVIDAGSDSLYKFNRNGSLVKAFGGKEIMNAPEGVAFLDKTLYIADTGNNRILRYVLSTDIK